MSEYECLVTNKLEATVTLSEEDKHIPKCIDIVDSLSEVVVEEESDDKDIPEVFLNGEGNYFTDEEDSYSREEVEEFSDEDDDLNSDEDDFNSDIYDDADHDSNSDYSDIISIHSNSEKKTESCNESLDSFEEATYCENCFREQV